MQKKLPYFTGFSLILAFVFLLVACDSEPPSSENKTEVLIRPAKLLEVGQIKSDDFLNYPAVIKSAQHSALKSVVS